MNQSPLFQAISALANFAYPKTERELEQLWQWRYHAEGVRFALVGSYHELRDLNSKLQQARFETSAPPTQAQYILGNFHAAYRDFQAVLLGVSPDLIDKSPAPGEWTIREIVSHVIYVKCFFFTLVHDGLMAARRGEKRPSFSQTRVAELIAGYADLGNFASQPTLDPYLAFFDQLHQRVISEFADMSNEELTILSSWWESEPVPLSWRLHRFDAHLREHTIQLEKTLAMLGQPLTEGKRQARRLYLALADAEKQLIGVDELEPELQSTFAASIFARIDEVTKRLTLAATMETAVHDNNLPQIKQIIEENPALVNAKDSNRLPITLAAAYRRQQDIVDFLVEAGADLDLFTATAVNQMERVQKQLDSGYWQINQTNIDGFNPLQLAAFFGHEALALWLIEQGADINAASANTSRIQPVHAAAAIGNLTILNALLEAGADANAQQAGGFTPLHAAAQTNNIEMAQLLLDAHADPAIANDKGHTAKEIATTAGHDAFVTFLRTRV